MNRKEQFHVKNFIFIFITGIINAIGVTMFLLPVKLYDSGISGVSMLLDQITPPFLVLSLFLIVLNIPIFIFGYKKQGIIFTVYSVFAVVVYSVVSFLITNVLPIDVSSASPLANNDLLLCSIFGGVLSGIGSGVVIRNGGAIDGMEVLSVIFAKRLNLSIGTFVLIFNVIFYIICGIVMSSWILPLYSIVTYFVESKTVDFIVDGFDKSKCAMIITDKAQEIQKAINNTFITSGTLVEGKGGYSNRNKNIIYYIVNRFQINKLKTLVTEIDSNAFVSILEVSEVVKQADKMKIIANAPQKRVRKPKAAKATTVDKTTKEDTITKEDKTVAETKVTQENTTNDGNQ